MGVRKHEGQTLICDLLLYLIKGQGLTPIVSLGGQRS